MKFAFHAALGLSLACVGPAFAAAPPAQPATSTAAPTPAHVTAVQNLLGAMQAENLLRGVAGRARYASPAQRQAVMAKIDRTPPAEIYRRMAAPLARTISEETATEMTRFYRTPYGKQVIHDRYNSRAQIMMGGTPPVPPQEKIERKRAAYVQASQALAAAQPAIDHEAFLLLQQIDKEQR